MSVRDTILANLETALQSVSGVSKVSRDFKEYPCPSATWYPALFIADDGGDEITNYCDNSKAQCTMLILVAGYYHRAANLSAGFNEFLENTINAIYAPVSLGSYARDCTIVSVNPIVTIPSENAALFYMHLAIKYWRTLGA
jgi:hypothetical protein